MLQESWDYTQVYRSPTVDGTYAQIGINIAIATSTFFDVDGTSTNYYKIRFYSSTDLVYSSFSTPMLGITEADQYTRLINAVTILGTLGAVGPDANNNFSIFGMSINQNVVEAIVDQVYDYTTELIGEGQMASTEATIIRRIKGFISTYSAVKILTVLTGISITVHFNYTSGGLNIQKSAVSQMASMMTQYTIESNRWRKLLLTRAIVSKQTDLDLTLINEQEPEGSGIQQITYDFPGI